MVRLLVILISLLHGNAYAAYGLVIHGGAGTLDKLKMTPELRKQYEKALNKALAKGYSLLEKGGSAVQAVEQAVSIMEDSPLFNAGKGAAYTSTANHVLEASIMSGNDLSIGAAIQLKHVKNPIQLAKQIMLHSRHTMISGKDAESIAKNQGLSIVPQHYFDTPTRKSLLTKWRSTHYYKDERLMFGTVGAVAIDKQGHLAAGTSTGGITGKLEGRIGDSPLIGAGTYADQHCAVSGTGHGEHFMRYHLASDICDRAKYQKISLSEAADKSFKSFTAFGGKGGIIAVDDNGEFIWLFNSKGMYRGVKLSNGKYKVEIYKEN
jgi:beta-aspartyl-peptidase (threonine type)